MAAVLFPILLNMMYVICKCEVCDEQPPLTAGATAQHHTCVTASDNEAMSLMKRTKVVIICTVQAETPGDFEIRG